MSDIEAKDILESIIMNDNAKCIKGNYIRDEAKVNAYIAGVKLLENLREIYNDFEYKADDINNPQYLHEIEITWKDEETNLPGQKISEILANFDSMIFSRERVLADKWLLSSEIYKEI